MHSLIVFATSFQVLLSETALGHMTHTLMVLVVNLARFGITQKGKGLVVSVRMFLRRVNQGWQTHTESGWHHSLGLAVYGHHGRQHGSRQPVGVSESLHEAKRTN